MLGLQPPEPGPTPYRARPYLAGRGCTEEHDRASGWGSGGVVIRGYVRRDRMSQDGSVAKFDFWGKIQKSGIRNATTYRLPNSRKSNFATEPQLEAGLYHLHTFNDAE